jgi:hypothetical protein
VGPRGGRITTASTMVDRCNDPHHRGIVSPCSFPTFFVTAATTHRAYTMSLPGRHGSTINPAWWRPSEMAQIDVMLLLTSPEIITNLRYKRYVFLRRKHENTSHRPHRQVVISIKKILWLDAICGGTRSGGPWRPWDDGGRHGRLVQFC